LGPTCGTRLFEAEVIHHEQDYKCRSHVAEN